MNVFWSFLPFHSPAVGGGVGGFRGSIPSAAALLEGMPVGREDESNGIFLLFCFHLQLSRTG